MPSSKIAQRQPLMWAAALLSTTISVAQAGQIILPGPAGSSRFGTFVTSLPSGDFVVVDVNATGTNGALLAGAVHHFRPDGTLVATLRGATSNDQVGSSGIVVLTNGNYLVRSPNWDNGSIQNAGAITFVRGDTGLAGVVSATNSLVGSSAEDRVGFGGITPLATGNYVVVASDWNHGAVSDAGAVIFGRGDFGIVGTISSVNALVGATTNDRIGNFGIVLLTNGNWLARHPNFDAGALVDAGAVSFGSATTGRTGVISAANSMVGTSAGDRVGEAAIGLLTNGNYVVPVPNWDNGSTIDAGAVAFGNGSSGTAGLVGPGIALVGTGAGDQVGSRGVTPLPSGNYLVASPNWRNGSVLRAGAVTFGNGSTGIVGAVSASNSLVGARADDAVGTNDPLILANGNWAIGTPTLDSATASDSGAVTFGFGTTGRTGTVAGNNSVTGGSISDRVGARLVALEGTSAQSIGHYVVVSPDWNGNGGLDVGAITVLSGTGGVSGPVSTLNSLVGAQSGDRVGSGGVVALPDGRFVVASPDWRNGASIEVGAVTLRESTPLSPGVVGIANSLVGAASGDAIGSGGVFAMPNSAYITLSPKFSPGSAIQAGAVTWAPAATGRIATVSAANSLVGSSFLDNIGIGGFASVTILDDGDAVVSSPFWDNGSIDDAGAVTYIDRDSGVSGPISALNSLIGGSESDAVGFNRIFPLPGGDHLISVVGWRNGLAGNAGAVTLGNDSGTTGLVTPQNSIVGSSANDLLGNDITVFPNGHYIVKTQGWDNGSTIAAGAVTLALPEGVVSGPLTSEHSVLGTVADGGELTVFAYDEFRNQMIVGQPLANRVVLHRSGASTSCGIGAPSFNPSDVGQLVTFDLSVSANSSAGTPDNGKFTVRTSNGQQCEDTTGTQIITGLAQFTCSIAFNQQGNISVFAEYTGSTSFAFCRTPTITQTVINSIFRNGFE